MTTDTQGVSSSAPSAADVAYASSAGHSTGYGLTAAISGILSLSNSLQALQGAVAGWATMLAGVVADYSEQNSEQAEKNTDALEAIGPTKDSNSDDQNAQIQKDQADAQAEAQKDNTIGQGQVTMSESKQEMVANSTTQISSQNSMLINMIGTIINAINAVVQRF